MTFWLLEIKSTRSFNPFATSSAFLAAVVASLAACVAAFVASAEATALESFSVFWISVILPCSFWSAASRAWASARSFLLSWSVIVPMFLLIVSTELTRLSLTPLITSSCSLSAPIRAAISLWRAVSTLVRFWPTDWSFLIKSLSDVTFWLADSLLIWL